MPSALEKLELIREAKRQRTAPAPVTVPATAPVHQKLAAIREALPVETANIQSRRKHRPSRGLPMEAIGEGPASWDSPLGVKARAAVKNIAAFDAGIVAGIPGGLAQLGGQVVDATADIMTVGPVRRGVRNAIKIARGEKVTEEDVTPPSPITNLAGEATRDAARTFAGWMGAGNNVDVPLAAGELVGTFVSPVPELKALGIGAAAHAGEEAVAAGRAVSHEAPLGTDLVMRDNTVDRIWNDIQKKGPDFEIEVPAPVQKAIKRGEIATKEDLLNVVNRDILGGSPVEPKAAPLIPDNVVPIRPAEPANVAQSLDRFHDDVRAAVADSPSALTDDELTAAVDAAAVKHGVALPPSGGSPRVFYRSHPAGEGNINTLDRAQLDDGTWRQGTGKVGKETWVQPGRPRRGLPLSYGGQDGLNRPLVNRIIDPYGSWRDTRPGPDAPAWMEAVNDEPVNVRLLHEETRPSSELYGQTNTEADDGVSYVQRTYITEPPPSRRTPVEAPPPNPRSGTSSIDKTALRDELFRHDAAVKAAEEEHLAAVAGANKRNVEVSPFGKRPRNAVSVEGETPPTYMNPKQARESYDALVSPSRQKLDAAIAARDKFHQSLTEESTPKSPAEVAVDESILNPKHGDEPLIPAAPVEAPPPYPRASVKPTVTSDSSPGQYVETSGVEVTSHPPDPPEPFDADAYVRRKVADREAARKKGVPTGLAKARAAYNDAKAAVVDKLAPIEDVINAAVKAEGRAVKPSEHITNALDRSIMSDHIAGQFARDNGMEEILRSAPDVDALGQYLIARHAQTLEAEGFTTGRDIAADTRLIATLDETYGPLAKQVDAYARKLLDYRVESGLVTREYADYVNTTYPEYVPVKRVFSEADDLGSRGVGSGNASISGQSTDLKLVGSKREIEDPIESLLAKTQQSFRQGETNKASRLLVSYHDLEGNPLGLQPIRTAENVNKRVAIIDDLGVIGREQRKLRRTAASFGSRLADTEKSLKRQFARVNEKIAETADDSHSIYEALRVAAADFDTNSVIDDLLAQGVATEKKISGLLDRVSGAQAKKMDRLETQGTQAERRLYELQGSREQLDYSATAERARTLKENLSGLNAAIDERVANVKAMRKELNSLRDKPKSPADSTISFLNDGVRETWKADPEVARAAKGLDVERVNLLGRIIAVPTRILKVGATGMNAVFITKNIPRDQMLAAVLSEHSASVMHPQNFTRAAFSALGHDELYRELVREGGMFTSFDIARNAPQLAIDEMLGPRRAFARARNRGTAATAKYLARTPGQLLRAAEDVVSRSEQLTRIQVYSGTRDALIAKGMAPEEARIAAKRASLWTTAPFHRSGQWGRVLNGAVPYLNANVQGWRVLLRGLKERPKEVGAKIAALVYLPVMGAVAWNLAEPDRRAAWDDISEREKNDNLVIVPPHPTQDERGRWNVIKIPLAQGVNDLVAPVRRSTEWAGRKALTGDERAQDMIGAILGPEDAGNKFLSTVTPQAIRPSVEVATNSNLYTGHHIVPGRMERIPTDKQAFPWTSGTARIIGKSIDTSPLKVEHFIRASAGGGGAQALNASDAMLAWMGIIPDEQVGGESVPAGIVRTFTKAYGGEIARRKRKSP